MARPSKSEAEFAAPAAPITPSMIGRKAKTVQLGLGLDLLASKMSVVSKDADMTLGHEGVHMLSKKNNREILIPYANIKGIELLPVDKA